ncbi:MAG: NAD(P)H-hydrate dehydratase, partial [Rhizobiales bacterium]|nr:NAD(P)H-hydrate dehydratase [Hyphomicrobiales bacterium]
TKLTGEVLVDCLFGSGLTRALTDDHLALLSRLAAGHRHIVAVDLPSGVESDSGRLLNQGLPEYDLTIALGAWKFAHFLMPAAARMGEMRLVGIGVDAVASAAHVISRPDITPPPPDAHKYRRGLLAVVGGAMPGAALLACEAAKGAGAGYIKLFSEKAGNTPLDVVVDSGKLSKVLTDDRNTAILVGPGLGRDAAALERLVIALADPVPAVLDADALVLLAPRLLAERKAAIVATPHEGELKKLEQSFELAGVGSKPERALALALASRMVIVAKGPDTVIAAPDGRIACAPRVTSWLSVAGTGDVLAGTIASRLAAGSDAFAAACEGVWLHGEAARSCSPAFGAAKLANAIPGALSACL